MTDLTAAQRDRLREVRDAGIAIRETIRELHRDLETIDDAAQVVQFTADELLDVTPRPRGTWPLGDD